MLKRGDEDMSYLLSFLSLAMLIPIIIVVVLVIYALILSIQALKIYISKNN